jgi:histidinol-phosphatase
VSTARSTGSVPARSAGADDRNVLARAQLAWGGIEDWDAVGLLDALIALGRACWRTRGIGEAWQYLLVAEGAAEIAVGPRPSIWDLAAFPVIIEEAGGRFTDLAGVRTLTGRSAIATNGIVHDAALAIVGHSAPDRSRFDQQPAAGARP